MAPYSLHSRFRWCTDLRACRLRLRPRLIECRPRSDRGRESRWGGNRSAGPAPSDNQTAAFPSDSATPCLAIPMLDSRTALAGSNDTTLPAWDPDHPLRPEVDRLDLD